MAEIKESSADEMGHELVLKIFGKELDSFKNLLESGANPNFCDEHTGNTPLHFLFLYNNCNTDYLKLLLDYGAEITTNSEKQFPIDIAQNHCNEAEFETIQNIFFQYASNKSLTTSKPGFISYQPTVAPLIISVTMPIVSMINGCLFSCWNRLSEKFPRLKNIIAYVLKPVALAMNNAIMNILFYRNLSYISSEDAIVFSYYLGVNYLGMLANQLGKRLTKKIQNIYFKFFLQSLFNAYLTNPSLLGHLAYEGLETPSFLLALGPMLSMIVSGFFFQIGECLTQKMIGKFFPVNTEHSNRNNQEYFLRYSVVGDMDGDLSEKKSLNALANNGDVGDVTKIAPHEGQNLLGSFTEYTEREAKTKEASVWGSACLFPPPPSEEELNQLNVATIVPKR